jgi:bifunctional non-homologous end joining protein LigD
MCGRRSLGADLRLDELPRADPRFIRKMDCVAVNDVASIPAGPIWLLEIKWKGYRTCVFKQNDAVIFRTKSNQEPSARYKYIAESLSSRSKLPACVLDAELVALDAEGRLSFQLLQQSRRNRAQIVLYVFDVLNYAGRDLLRLPLEIRRAALRFLPFNALWNVHKYDSPPPETGSSSASGSLREEWRPRTPRGIACKLCFAST